MANREENIIRARENYRRKHDRDGSWARFRAAERARRTPGQQLALLDARLGAGVGAKKERARLCALIAGEGYYEVYSSLTGPFGPTL